MAQIKLELFIIITLTCLSVSHAKVKGASPVDILRDTYQKQQDELWQYVNIRSHRLADNQDAQDKVYAYYKNLTEQDWMSTRLDDDDFPIVRRFSEWFQHRDEIFKVQNLWDDFRKFIQTQYVTDNFNEVTAIDFTDTVFHNEQLTLNESLAKIHLIMVQQNLYYKVAIVSSETLTM